MRIERAPCSLAKSSAALSNARPRCCFCKRGIYGEESQVPGIIIHRLEPDCSDDCAAFRIAMDEKVRMRLRGKILVATTSQ